MISRKKIISRSLDNLDMIEPIADEEDVWHDMDVLCKHHIEEILSKWDQIDDEIWAKIIVFEKNRRVAKAYARSQVISINGSKTGFDGVRIGLNGFENPMRDSETKVIKKSIGEGFKLKMDDIGNILIKRYGKSNIYVDGIEKSNSDDSVIGSDIMKIKNRGLVLGTSSKLFDIQKFTTNINREFNRIYPDCCRLERQCLSAVSLVKSSSKFLNSPLWILVINVVALDMLRNRTLTSCRNIDNTIYKTSTPGSEDPYSTIESPTGSDESNNSSNKRGKGDGKKGFKRIHWKNGSNIGLLSEKSAIPKKFDREIPNKDVPNRIKYEYNTMQRKKQDDPYYCGLLARIPNFIKTPKQPPNKQRQKVEIFRKTSTQHIPERQPLHPIPLAAFHQYYPYKMYPANHRLSQSQLSLWDGRNLISTDNEAGDNCHQRPITPINAMIPSNLAITPKDHPFMAQIQRDLNSPSATARIRALKALKSPTKCYYSNFNIPNEEQDIITEEERRERNNPKSIQELMKDVVVYVEVRTGEDNRSAGVKKVISALGAKVNDKLLKDTTHVVFKDGLLSTYNKAKKLNIPIVSILWIEACKTHRQIVNPKNYPISNADRYENPELYEKIKRHKSMQPDAENNRKIRTKPATPKKCANLKKTDLNEHIPTQLESNNKRSNKLIDSPAVELRHRNQIASNSNERNSIRIQDEDPNGTLKPIATENNHEAKLSRMSTRRKSLMQNNNLGETKEISLPPLRRSRRSSLNIYSSKKLNTTNEMNLPKNKDEIINEEEESEDSNMKLSLSSMEENITNKRVTTYSAFEPSETMKTPEINQKTILSPKKMEMTPFDDIRKTDILKSSLNVMDALETPMRVRSLLEEHASIIRYNSSKSPSKSTRRRTLFDVSMDIISQRLQNINQSAKFTRYSQSNSGISVDSIEPKMTPITPMDDKNIRKELFTKFNDSCEEKPLNTPTTITATSKKRKLFDPNDLLPLISSGESTDTSHATVNSIISKQKIKRRQTLIPKYLQSETNKTNASRRRTAIFQPILNNKNQSVNTIRHDNNTSNLNAANIITSSTKTNKNETKSQFLPSMVYTSMPKEQIDVIKEAIEKIGEFQLEDTVSDMTTHVISFEPCRTLNILHAIVRGLWILNYKWITDSLLKGCWLNEEDYEIKEISRAVEICRSERQAFGFGYKLDLFAAFGPIYISSKSSPISKEDLKTLVQLCSGKVVNNRKLAKYIIGDSNNFEIGKIYLNPYWVIDSITKKQIQKFSRYTSSQAGREMSAKAKQKTKTDLLSQQF